METHNCIQSNVASFILGEIVNACGYAREGLEKAVDF
jgi:hypothetical protein